MRAEGIHDSRENALTYVRLIAGDQSEDEIIETFVDEGPKMVEFVAANTPIKWGYRAGSSSRRLSPAPSITPSGPALFRWGEAFAP